MSIAEVPFINEENKELFTETMNALHYNVLICDPLLVLQPELFETIKVMLITCGVSIIMKEINAKFNVEKNVEKGVEKSVKNTENKFADFMKNYFRN